MTPRPACRLQWRLWFFSQLYPELPFFTIPLLLRVRGRLDRAGVRAVLQVLLERHESLRTCLRAGSDGPYQVLEPAELDMTDVDLSAAADPEADWDRLVTAELEKPMDLAAGPVFRAVLARLSEADHLLGLFIHHVGVDDVSVEVLQDEFGRLYEAWRSGLDLSDVLGPRPASYASFSAWLDEAALDPAYQQSLEYWARQLRDVADFDVPTDLPRPASRAFEVGEATVPLPDTVAAALGSFARDRRVTPFHVFTAALAVLLASPRHGGDAVLATPYTLRHDEWLDRTVGFFVNTVPLRVRVGDAPAFDDVLTAARDTIFEAMDNHHVPFDDIVTAANPERDLSRSPLTPVIFQVFDMAAFDPTDAGELQITRVPGPLAASEYDLMWEVLAYRDGRFTLRVKYTADVYRPSTVTRMCRDLVQILEQGLSAPDRPVPNLTRHAPLIDPARVEAALAELPGVDACRVVSGADGGVSRADCDGTAATAYIAISDESLTPQAIRDHLATRLPEELIPAWFVLLDQLPLDDAGRVDLAALNALSLADADPAMPRSPLEEPVRAVWEQHLGRPVPDPEVPFFNVDGNSLVAVRIAAELQSTFDIPVPVRTIFEHPTIRALAGYLEAHRTSPDPDSEPADQPATGDHRLGADLAAASEEELDALLALVEGSIG